MLDKYIIGDTERISPEAPIPVVHVSKELSTPGGAGNVALNCATLGSSVFLIGTIGKGPEGKELTSLLKKSKKIDISQILSYNNIHTIQKTRIIARGQHVVRFDKETKNPKHPGAETKFLKFLEKNIQKLDIIILSDYAKGLLTKNLCKKIIHLGNKHKKIVIGDVKPKTAARYKGCFIITPNKKEAFEISNEESVSKAGKKIQKNLNCNVLLTRGPEGMSLFEKNSQKDYPTKAQEVFDIAGAGDTVVASLALALAAGASLEEATIISNHAAGVVVSKVGTATVTAKELINDLESNQ